MTVIFYLKKSKSSPTDLIMMKVYDAQFKYGVFVCSTKERIEPEEWVQPKKKTGEKLASGRPKRGHETLQRRLLDLEKQVLNYIREHRHNLSRNELKLHLDGHRPKEVTVEKPKTLLQEWQEYLEIVKGNVAANTYSNYRNSFETMEEFLKKRGLSNILPIQFDLRLFQRYRSFLKEKYSSENSVSKRIKHFKMMLNQGVKIAMDLDEMKFKETAGLKISLTEEELASLIKLKLEGRFAKVRDLFVIQCHTGVRVSDLFRLDKNIKDDSFEFEQKKTGKPVRIPILPVVQEILERYMYKLPFMSEQKYNDGIKDVYKELNKTATIQIRDEEGFKNVPVWKLISSHDAVRTFITISAERGVPVPSIAKITGKTIGVLLKNYLVDSQKVAEKEILEKWPNPAPMKVDIVSQAA